MGSCCSSDSSEPSQTASHSPKEVAQNPMRTLNPAARSLTVSPTSDRDESNFSIDRQIGPSPQAPALPMSALSLADSRDSKDRDTLRRVMPTGGNSEDPAFRSTSTLGKEPPAEGRGAIVSWTNIPETSTDVVPFGMRSASDGNTNGTTMPQPELLSGSSTTVATWTESGANSALSQPEMIRDSGSMLSSWFGHMSNGGAPDTNSSANSRLEELVDITSSTDEQQQGSPQSSNFSMKGTGGA